MFKLKSLVAERELICKDLMSQNISVTEAGERLVLLTNELHALAT